MMVVLALWSGCSEPPARPPPDIAGPPPAPDLDPAPGRVVFDLVASAVVQPMYGDADTEVWSYNGQVPGPTLQARVGDEVVINFVNDLAEPTTIHWHGLRISDQMDGVPAIQDPVQPGEAFTYRFTVPEAGTFWYHPHVRGFEQVERGLYGAFVVHPAQDVPGAGERVFLVDDVLLAENGALAPFRLVDDHVTQSHGRIGTDILINGQLASGPRSSASSANERWRVVNTSNASPLRVTIEGGQTRIIGRDGGLIPVARNSSVVDLPVGGRVDFEVRGEHGETVSLVVGPARLAVGEPSSARADVQWMAGPSAWVRWPAPEPQARLEVEQEVTLTFDRAGGGTDRTWTINGAEWGRHAPIDLRGGVPTRVVLKDESSAPHPFHLHGQFFRVVARNSQSLQDDAAYDTVMLGPDEEVELYTLLDNPGRWMAHCHILAHAERGMMTEIRVRAQEEAQ